MTSNRIRIVLTLGTLAIASFAFTFAAEDIPPDRNGKPDDAIRPLKVFILAGQSNMQGSAHKHTFAAIGDDPKSAALLSEILDQNGEPVVSDNAWITYLTGNRDGDTVLSGRVKVGYGFDDDRIGLEYAFGLYMDKALDEPILIIKTAWGGKSLAVDFRPPSAGPYEPSANEKERGNVPPREMVGHYYREMIGFVRATLKDVESIRKVIPSYDAQQGYELAGFVWFQGWNDMCNRHHIEQYTENMIHFIRDVRKEFDAPTLSFIVGILGVCRAGSTTSFYFGDNARKLAEDAWYVDNSGDDTHPVGLKRPNRWGLYDMHGNASEWVLDQFSETYDPLREAVAAGEQPIHWPTRLHPRTVRGGSWDSDAVDCRSAARVGSSVDWHDEEPQIPPSPHWLASSVQRQIGFRIARPLNPPPSTSHGKYWDVDVDELKETVTEYSSNGHSFKGIVDPKLPAAIKKLKK